MKVERVTSKSHSYRCVGCDKRADLVVDFGQVHGVIAFCCACAIGAAEILDDHATYFRDNQIDPA